MGIGLLVDSSLRVCIPLHMYVAFYLAPLLIPHLLFVQAYTILQSNTGSLFLHMTMSEPPLAPYWGNILKSNWNGTYFGLSVENVNRNEEGYVDFEKVIGLDGIALINVIANPDEAVVTKRKTLQSRITHNDGEQRSSYHA